MSSTERAWLRRSAVVGLWILIVFELQIGLAGMGKFRGDAWIQWFEGWGYDRWFARAIGAAEIGGAVLLLVRPLASYAAALLVVIMLGAIWTVMTHESQLGPGAPTLHTAVLGVILVARWKSRWRPGVPVLRGS